MAANRWENGGRLRESAAQRGMEDWTPAAAVSQVRVKARIAGGGEGKSQGAEEEMQEEECAGEKWRAEGK